LGNLLEGEQDLSIPIAPASGDLSNLPPSPNGLSNHADILRHFCCREKHVTFNNYWHSVQAFTLQLVAVVATSCILSDKFRIANIYLQQGFELFN